MDDLFLTSFLIKRNWQEDQEEKMYPDRLQPWISRLRREQAKVKNKINDDLKE
jgi:hypothetical protein